MIKENEELGKNESYFVNILPYYSISCAFHKDFKL